MCIQHLQDILDLRMSALDWMLKAYPEVKEREDMRRIVGRYGLTGAQQVLTRDWPKKSLYSLVICQTTVYVLKMGKSWKLLFTH